MSRARTCRWERLNAATCFSTVARSATEGSSGSEATWYQTVMYVLPAILPSHVVSEAWRCFPLPSPPHATTQATRVAITIARARMSDERV